MENEIKLEELLPISSTFSLKRFDDFEFLIQPCTTGKLMDMTKRLGDIEKLLTIPSAENISKIAMMLLDYDSAVKFKKQKVKIIDVMSGDEVETEVGGYKILMHSIEGIKEQYSIYRCILLSLGYGKEKTDGIIKELISSMNKNVNETIQSIEKKSKKIAE